MRNFLPSIGRLTRYLPPQGEGVRVDTGVFEGAEISIYYDPMIAKLVGYGASRAEATRRLGEALNAYYIRGLSHNVAFLAAVLRKERFAAGRALDQFHRRGVPARLHRRRDHARRDGPTAIAVAAAVQRITAESEARDRRPARRPRPRRAAGLGRCASARRSTASLATRENGAIAVTDAQGRRRGRGERVATGPAAVPRHDRCARPVIFQLDRDGIGFRLTRDGASLAVKVLPPRAAELLSQMPAKQAPDLSRFLLSPMPGLLVSIAVGEGEEVKAGEELAVVEAMKMENVLRAERDGTVGKAARQARRQPRRRPGHPRIRLRRRCPWRRCRLVITGRVQGVGFRALDARARRAGGRLRGWVRNRSDGSVEALLIGDGETVERLAEACRRGPGTARVEAVGRFPADDDGSADFSERATA